MKAAARRIAGYARALRAAGLARRTASANVRRSAAPLTRRARRRMGHALNTFWFAMDDSRGIKEGIEARLRPEKKRESAAKAAMRARRVGLARQGRRAGGRSGKQAARRSETEARRERGGDGERGERSERERRRGTLRGGPARGGRQDSSQRGGGVGERVAEELNTLGWRAQRTGGGCALEARQSGCGGL